VERFTRAVAGSCARGEPLLSAGAGLHPLPVSPQIMARPVGADVVVLNDLALEAPLERRLAADGSRGPRRMEAAAGIDPLWLGPTPAISTMRMPMPMIPASSPTRPSDLPPAAAPRRYAESAGVGRWWKHFSKAVSATCAAGVASFSTDVS
jgi:hypothetical protein